MYDKKENEKRIERKKEEIANIEKSLGEARAYLQALQDTVKFLPKDSLLESPEKSLRAGSNMAKARDAILKAGEPLHVLKILAAIGKEPNKANRLSLGGSLSGYVRKGFIFNKPKPGVFGLIEMGKEIEPPSDFGTDEEAKTN